MISAPDLKIGDLTFWTTLWFKTTYCSKGSGSANVNGMA